MSVAKNQSQDEKNLLADIRAIGCLTGSGTGIVVPTDVFSKQGQVLSFRIANLCINVSAFESLNGDCGAKTLVIAYSD